MTGGRDDRCFSGHDDVFDVLEARGREIVAALHARCVAERRANGPASDVTERAFAQTRAYQALLVGHVDFARRPSRLEDERAFHRGHVELILAVLRLMGEVAHAADAAPRR